jgi:transposase
MALGARLTVSEQKDILRLSKKKMSHRDIAKKIRRSKTVVTNFLRDPDNYGTKKPTGRKPKLDNRSKRLVIRTASNKAITCSKIIKDLSLNVSRWTVNRVIKKSGVLKNKKKKKSPVLTDTHKRARVDWAKTHMTWKSEWQKVIWSDEKKFNLDGPDGFSYYWHDIRKEEQIFSTRSHGGGSVMIWASFGWYGKSELCFIDGKMNAEGYRKVLQNHLLSFGSAIPIDDWVFQQDNAPAHRAKANFAWFKRHKINVLPWPSKSPDLNPIENLWATLVRKVYEGGMQFQTKEDLKKAIVKSWDEIRERELHNLVNSMPNRIFEIINNHGNKINY